MSDKQLYKEKMNLGQQYQQANKWEQAVNIYGDLLWYFSEDIAIHDQLGFCYMKLHQWRKALDEYECILKLAPDDLNALEKAAYLYRYYQRWEDVCKTSIHLAKLCATLGQLSDGSIAIKYVQDAQAALSQAEYALSLISPIAPGLANIREMLLKAQAIVNNTSSVVKARNERTQLVDPPLSGKDEIAARAFAAMLGVAKSGHQQPAVSLSQPLKEVKCSLGHKSPLGTAFCGECGEAFVSPSQKHFPVSQEKRSSVDSVTPSPLSEPAMIDDELQELLSSTQLPSNTILKERYYIVERVGKGGMGAVYKARDTTFTERFVAVKQMFQSGLAPQMLSVYTDNFKREANMLAGLIHPNLPRIYDYFSEGECWYLVMDYIEGINLQKHLEQAGGRLSVEETLRIGIDLCTVLGYLHSQQQPIVFRDLKPANVMMAQRGHLYLIDFGIARQYKPEQTKDTHHFLTAGYGAPEQYGHSQTQTTPRSDIYSLGATLHQMLSGNNPSDTPFDFVPLGIGIPELATLVQQMLEIRPANRPVSTEVVRQELQRILAQVQSGAKPTPQPDPWQPFRPPEQIKPSPRGAFGYFHMLEGKEPGRIYELRKDTFTIGRSRESDMFLEDLAVSRLHATVIRQGNDIYTIKDQGTANGTKVNGQSVTRYQTYPLQDGDKIQVGSTVLVFGYR